MDRLTVLDKTESLRRCILRVESKRAPSAEVLRTDVDRQDILSLNLTRAVQLCADIAGHWLATAGGAAPQSLGETFERLAQLGIITPALAERLRKAVGFRTFAIHHYRAIDCDIVHAISHGHLQDFEHFAAAILRALDQSQHKEQAP